MARYPRVDLELPANNQYWKSEVLRKVLSNQHLEFEGIVNGCSMKMFTKSQQPVGKRFRFMSNRKEVANRLAERFKCQSVHCRARSFQQCQLDRDRTIHPCVRSILRSVPEE